MEFNLEEIPGVDGNYTLNTTIIGVAYNPQAILHGGSSLVTITIEGPINYPTVIEVNPKKAVRMMVKFVNKGVAKLEDLVGKKVKVTYKLLDELVQGAPRVIPAELIGIEALVE